MICYNENDERNITKTCCRIAVNIATMWFDNIST